MEPFTYEVLRDNYFHICGDMEVVVPQAPGQRLPARIYDRDALAPGMRIAGPAIVEEDYSNTVVCPDQHLYVDECGNLSITIGKNVGHSRGQ